MARTRAWLDAHDSVTNGGYCMVPPNSIQPLILGPRWSPPGPACEHGQSPPASTYERDPSRLELLSIILPPYFRPRGAPEPTAGRRTRRFGPLAFMALAPHSVPDRTSRLDRSIQPTTTTPIFSPQSTYHQPRHGSPTHRPGPKASSARRPSSRLTPVNRRGEANRGRRPEGRAFVRPQAARARPVRPIFKRSSASSPSPRPSPSWQSHLGAEPWRTARPGRSRSGRWRRAAFVRRCVRALIGRLDRLGSSKWVGARRQQRLRTDGTGRDGFWKARVDDVGAAGPSVYVLGAEH